MNETHIGELLAPFLSEGIPSPPDDRAAGTSEVAVLSPQMPIHISMYIDILLRWDARINLTAVRDPEEIVTRHFGESLFTARHLFPQGSSQLTSAAQPGSHVIDVGSGAGFPGLPIKLWEPRIRLTLIESNQKKVTFLRELVRALALSEVDVFPGRAEAYQGDKGDLVTLRAVERFETILPTALGMLGRGGRLALLIGEAQVETAKELVTNLKWDKPVRIPSSSRRILMVGKG